MTRNEFLKMCGILGIGIPLNLSLSSCGDKNNGVPFDGKVIIIGAGAGGLTAGYLLEQQGTEYEILEASPIYGGRMRINNTFADFPIPLGAEWLETGTSIFSKIVNDSSVQVDVETVADNPDRKFVNYSWYNFYEEYIHPSVANKINYNTVVQSIDYSDQQIVVTTQAGQHIADKVIVAVPLKILRNQTIDFTPSLPQAKLDVINSVNIWHGFKAFFEFSNKFYQDDYVFDISPTSAGQKIYYNAALGQNTNMNIMGLFTVGSPALDYMGLTDDELRDYILNELDGIYSNQATPNYVKHLSQNWNNEPFIQGGYMTDHANWKDVRELGKSVSNKLYFAGGAFTDGNDWVSVHAAAQSAIQAIQDLNS